ncbi:BTAD domain-containing putative transcriptional regulator [Streptomyces xiamenensis]|uniref:AfsR/SARP family transcriptional regulator n=1 Tax=Streptomyces xiamenensis TaxID=408015 RepID=UPI0035DAAD8A
MAKNAIRCEVLGPLRALDGTAEIDLGPPRQRAVLAALLLRGPRPVTVDGIISAVWGSSPPGHAVNLVQKYISGLRRALPAGTPITLTGSGYVLRPEGGLDLWEFEELCARARTLRDAGRPAEAIDALGRAVGLWRGDLVEGTDGPGIELERDRLTERLVAAEEEMYGLGLRLGRGAEHVPELVRLTSQYPQRERLHGLLMRSLAQSGRQTEALDVYTRVRRRLAEEYGADPGPELRDAHQWVLSGAADERRPGTGAGAGAGAREVGRDGAGGGGGDDDARAAVAPPAGPAPAALAGGYPPVAEPAQLPYPVFGFTGRTAEAKRITSLLLSGGMPVVCVEGTAGIGKTALAVRCAQQVAASFPDGQLFADLRGFDPLAPVEPGQVLGEFLRALGVPPRRIPPAVHERSALLRSVLAHRRALLVLDNAADADQVLPLLPGSAHCAVLITSRRRLTGLAVHSGAHRVQLPVLSVRESDALLRTVLGPPAAGDEAAIAEIARLCGHLPLALRVVAARAAISPHIPLAAVARRLAESGPLAGVSAPEDERVSVAASLALSYRGLDTTVQRVLRHIGLIPGPDLTQAAAAAVAGVAEPVAGRALSVLSAAHLIEQHHADRFRFPHDLLREYARQRVYAEEDRGEREAAVRRLSAWYLRTASVLGGGSGHPHVVGPHGRMETEEGGRDGPAGPESALPNAEAELPNYAAMAAYAARHGPYPVAWRLAGTLHDLCKRRSLVAEWLTMAEAGLRAAERAQDARAAAELALTLVDASLTAGLMAQAERHARRALAIGEEHGWPRIRAAAHEQLGRRHWTIGELGAARERLTESVRLYGEGGDGSHLHTAMALCALARVEADSGVLERAFGLYGKALRLSRAERVPHLESMVLIELALVHRALGRSESAALSFEAALARSRASCTGLRPQALALAYLAELDAERGRAERAGERAAEAVRIARDQGDQWALAEAHNAAGRALAALGDPGAAAGHHRAALELAGTLSYRRAELHALVGLAATTTDPSWARRATALAAAHGYDLGQLGGAPAH